MRRRIFVFGSNLMGYHGGGAAEYARRECGAEQGTGEGLTGDSYALPTCKAPGKPLSYAEVAKHVDNFREFASANPDLDFLFTAVGCGIAGFSTRQIANLCHGFPDNVYLQSRLAYGFAQ
jgi:hypothetical protein